MVAHLQRISKIGEIVRDRRDILGMSQNELASIAETSKRTIIRIENSQCERISLPVLERVFDTLKMDILIERRELPHLDSLRLDDEENENKCSTEYPGDR